MVSVEQLLRQYSYVVPEGPLSQEARGIFEGKTKFYRSLLVVDPLMLGRAGIIPENPNGDLARHLLAYVEQTRKDEEPFLIGIPEHDIESVINTFEPADLPPEVIRTSEQMKLALRRHPRADRRDIYHIHTPYLSGELQPIRDELRRYFIVINLDNAEAAPTDNERFLQSILAIQPHNSIMPAIICGHAKVGALDSYGNVRVVKKVEEIVNRLELEKKRRSA